MVIQPVPTAQHLVPRTQFVNHIFQIQEFDTPEHLLSNDQGAFSKMVQSTGHSNAEYLKVICICYIVIIYNLAMCYSA